jgi:hypothetical protein
MARRKPAAFSSAARAPLSFDAVERGSLGHLEDHAVGDAGERCLREIELLVVEVRRVEVHEEERPARRGGEGGLGDLAAYASPELVDSPELLGGGEDVGGVVHERLVGAQERLVGAQERFVAEDAAVAPAHDRLVRHPQTLHRRVEPLLQRRAIDGLRRGGLPELESLLLQTAQAVGAQPEAHHLHEGVVGDWLHRVTKRGLLDGADGRVDRRLVGHEHDGYVEAAVAHVAEELQTTVAGHVDGADDDVEALLVEPGHRVEPVPRRGRRPSLAAKERLDGANRRRVTVDDENLNLGFGHIGHQDGTRGRDMNRARVSPLRHENRTRSRGGAEAISHFAALRLNRA